MCRTLISCVKLRKTIWYIVTWEVGGLSPSKKVKARNDIVTRSVVINFAKGCGSPEKKAPFSCLHSFHFAQIPGPTTPRISKQPTFCHSTIPCLSCMIRLTLAPLHIHHASCLLMPGLPTKVSLQGAGGLAPGS